MKRYNNRRQHIRRKNKEVFKSKYIQLKIIKKTPNFLNKIMPLIHIRIGNLEVKTIQVSCKVNILMKGNHIKTKTILW